MQLNAYNTIVMQRRLNGAQLEDIWSTQGCPGTYMRIYRYLTNPIRDPTRVRWEPARPSEMHMNAYNTIVMQRRLNGAQLESIWGALWRLVTYVHKNICRCQSNLPLLRARQAFRDTLRRKHLQCNAKLIRFSDKQKVYNGPVYDAVRVCRRSVYRIGPILLLSSRR